MNGRVLKHDDEVDQLITEHKGMCMPRLGRCCPNVIS